MRLASLCGLGGRRVERCPSAPRIGGAPKVVLQEGKEAENAVTRVSIALGSSDPKGHATPLLHFSASLHYADMVGVRSPLDAFVRAFGATALRTFDQAVGNGFQNLKALRSRLPGNVSTTMSLADLGTPKVPYTPFFSSLSLLLHPPRPPDLTPASHVGSALIPGSRAHHSAHVHVRNARSFAARRSLSFQKHLSAGNVMGSTPLA